MTQVERWEGMAEESEAAVDALATKTAELKAESSALAQQNVVRPSPPQPTCERGGRENEVRRTQWLRFRRSLCADDTKSCCTEFGRLHSVLLSVLPPSLEPALQRQQVLEKAMDALQKETLRLGKLYEDRDEGLLGRVAALEAPRRARVGEERVEW